MLIVRKNEIEAKVYYQRDFTSSKKIGFTDFWFKKESWYANGVEIPISSD